MPEEMFLKLSGIDGESIDAKHKGEIDVLAWSWGLSEEGVPATGGAGAGKVKISEPLDPEAGRSRFPPATLL